MLIALYFVFKNFVPKLASSAHALLQPALIIIITLAGIVMLFGAVGLRVSNNLGSTIVGGIFRAIGYAFRTFLRAIRWFIRNVIPSIFNGVRRFLNQLGMNAPFSTLFALLITIIIIVVII